MKRRHFLGLGVGAAAASGAVSPSGVGSASARSADDPFHGRAGQLVAKAFEYVTRAMDAYQQGGTLRLIQSYSDAQRPIMPATAFIYDASLAIIAFLGRRGRDGPRRAVLLGDSLLYAQTHDPVYSDGRLRWTRGMPPGSTGARRRWRRPTRRCR